MAVPFMRAYARLLVATCHRRGAHAIGGMSAFIPNRREPEVTANALARVREDKEREAGDGFDGTWVAHPDLVPVAARGLRPGARERDRTRRRRPGEADVAAAALLDVTVPGRPGDRGRRPSERQRRDPLPRRVAARERRGGDRQPHGGHGDGGDLALPAVAVAAARHRRSRTATPFTADRYRRIRDEELERIGRCHRASRRGRGACSTTWSSPTTSPSSSPGRVPPARLNRPAPAWRDGQASPPIARSTNRPKPAAADERAVADDERPADDRRADGAASPRGPRTACSRSSGGGRPRGSCGAPRGRTGRGPRRGPPRRHPSW